VNESNQNRVKVGKVLLGIFAAIGLYIVLSILSQMIFPNSMRENECLVHAISAFSSPQNEYIAELTYKTCGNRKAISEIILHPTDNKSGAAVLLSVKRKIEGRGVVPYPPNISLNWESSARLVIAVPREDMPAQKTTESYGVSISYVPTL